MCSFSTGGQAACGAGGKVWTTELDTDSSKPGRQVRRSKKRRGLRLVRGSCCCCCRCVSVHLTISACSHRMMMVWPQHTTHAVAALPHSSPAQHAGTARAAVCVGATSWRLESTRSRSQKRRCVFVLKLLVLLPSIHTQTSDVGTQQLLAVVTAAHLTNLHTSPTSPYHISPGDPVVCTQQ